MNEPVTPPSPSGGFQPSTDPAWIPPTGVPPTPERWFEPSTHQATQPAPPRSGGGRTIGLVLGTAVLSAAVAMGGTLAVLSATGALDRPAAVAEPQGQEAEARQPVVIEESSAIIDVATAVSPAVVKIVTGGSTDDPFSIPDTGVGSGVIYDAAGWVLTNRHVVAGSDTVTVELKDGRELSGTVYGIDTLTDLAIVKVAGDSLPTANLGSSSELAVGQTVVAIGSPLGTYSSSVTAGILSATGRAISVEGGRLTNLLQTDAAINPGNSGGPLIDAGGAVIGINTAIASDAEGIGFAIPIDIAKPIMRQAVAGQELARPYLGVNYTNIDRQLAEERDLPVTDGALIGPRQGANGQTGSGVEPGTPAAEAGLRDGDIIVRVEDLNLDELHPLDLVLSQYAPGLEVTLGVLRDGSTVDVTVVLGTRPSDL
jgi:S1-C subfamily serine protease